MQHGVHPSRPPECAPQRLLAGRVPSGAAHKVRGSCPGVAGSTAAGAHGACPQLQAEAFEGSKTETSQQFTLGHVFVAYFLEKWAALNWDKAYLSKVRYTSSVCMEECLTLGQSVVICLCSDCTSSTNVNTGGHARARDCWPVRAPPCAGPWVMPRAQPRLHAQTAK